MGKYDLYFYLFFYIHLKSIYAEFGSVWTVQNISCVYQLCALPSGLACGGYLCNSNHLNRTSLLSHEYISIEC
jgi:hypothetical protein